jgi:hypothetical protein
MAMTASRLFAFDEVWLALLVWEAREPHDSREVMNRTITTCPDGDLFLKRRELRECDVGNPKTHGNAPRWCG